MRSCASWSASRVVWFTWPRAASVSAALTLIPALRRSTPSSLRVRSASARSPSARTCATIAATLSLTSSACSRFCPSSALKPSSKLGSAVLSHTAMGMRGLGAAGAWRVACAGLIAGMLGLEPRTPFRPEISELGLDAFDFELDRGVARESERERAGRRHLRRKADGEQRQHSLARPEPHILELRAEHPVETERGAPAQIILARVPSPLLPFEAVERGGETPLFRQIRHIGHAQHRVLEQRGQDSQVFLVKGDEFQRFHGQD